MKYFVNIQEKELPFALNMFSLFFFIISVYWVLKPLKKGLFFSFYKECGGASLLYWHFTAAQAELLAKVINLLAAIILVAVFSWLSRRWRRDKLAYRFIGAFMVLFVFFGYLLQKPGEWSVWAFYVFGDVFNMAMVATFFAFLNDSVSPETAKRLYGPVVLGGILGGVFGSTVVNFGAGVGLIPAWLSICILFCLVMMFNVHHAGTYVRANPPERKEEPAPPREEGRKSHPALEGARIAFRSPYVFSIVAIVACYEIVSSLVDFQFSSTIERFADQENMSALFAGVLAGGTWLSFFVQFFLTTFILTRLGVTAGLLMLPFALFAGSLGFAAFPRIMTASLLNVIDNGFGYSIQQSAKETLYVPTDYRVKYSAKAFIDMFVQRLGKVIAIVFTLSITMIYKDYTSVRWISLVTIGMVVLWIGRARHAGKAFRKLTDPFVDSGLR